MNGMLTPWLKLFVGLLGAGAYAGGLFYWVYRNRLWPALISMLILYPLLILVTRETSWTFLRAVPIVGIFLFLHRSRGDVLRQIRLLWFTTLSVAVVHVYYLVIGVY
jgi:hypothetical protein